jgi:hypothetical protein
LQLPALPRFATNRPLFVYNHAKVAAMNRRAWLRSLAGSLVVMPLAGRELLADPQIANLSETLTFGLKCRRPEEFEFVELVVHKVEEGVLPLAMVLSMFKWSRERRPDQPFPYFQAGLQERASKIGVDL